MEDVKKKHILVINLYEKKKKNVNSYKILLLFINYKGSTCNL